MDVVSIIKKTLPAVVSITSSKELKQKTLDLFGSEILSSDQLKKKRVNAGGGSGFIVDDSGIIFTNRHVIEDPSMEYKVVLQNKEELVPEIIAKDLINDIAVLKVNLNTVTDSKLPCLELGDSSDIELGEQVIAIGNVLGMFDNTVSRGIISGLSRSIMAQSASGNEKTKLKGLLQTDAAINPGNSGGPLINMAGQVIGINSATIYGAENVGFALPINNAKKDLDDILVFGRIREPFLGVRYIIINDQIRDKYSLPSKEGALVISEPDPVQGLGHAIVIGSPAYKAGLKEADIIIEMAGQKINQDQTILDVIHQHKIGEQIPMKIIREKKIRNLKILLAEKN